MLTRENHSFAKLPNNIPSKSHVIPLLSYCLKVILHSDVQSPEKLNLFKAPFVPRSLPNFLQILL